MAKTFAINDKSIEDGDKYFFDANIWIFIFSLFPGQNEDKQRLYSNFLKKYLKKGKKININSLILSEIVNEFIQYKFKSYKDLVWKIIEKLMNLGKTGKL